MNKEAGRETVLQVLLLYGMRGYKLLRGGGQKRTMSDAAAKSPNRCHNFALNPIDAFGENEKGYQLRKQKKTQCDGQLSLFQGTENRIKHMNFSGGEGV